MADEQNRNEPETSKSGKSLFGFLASIVPYFRPYRGWLLCILLAMAVNLGFECLLPLSFKFLIDRAIVPRDTSRLILILSVLAAGALMTSICLLGQDLAYARLETGVLADLRIRLFSHLQKLSMSFFGRWPLGDILSRFGTDMASVEHAITSSLAAALGALIGLLISVGLLFSIEWRLALFAVVGVTLAFYGARLLEGRAAQANYQMKEQEGKAAALVQENLGAQVVIKGFGLQQLVQDLFVKEMGVLRRARLRATTRNYIMQRIPQAGVLIVCFLVVGIGALLAFRGQMSVGDLVAFNGLLMQLTNYVAGLTWASPFLMEAAAGMKRIEDILNEQPQVQDLADAGALPPVKDGIAFHQVTFSYNGSAPNLREVNLQIPRGASIALVGPSGSGKSTLLNLIMRFYDPNAGSVTIDGVDLKSISQESLRRRIGVVFQESLLFNTTIRENIRLGKLQATAEEIQHAARLAGVHDFVERLPEGYETAVGERGGKLSGGQRQRIGIARAILRNPDILVLDEATSALDPVTEAAVNATIKAVTGERTIISVTHRLAPVVHCDRIFVFDRGYLVESGRHQELLERQGVYARLWQKQSGLAISADGESATVSAERLRQIRILSSIGDHLLGELAGMFVTEHCPQGREIIRQGDPGDRFYIVVRGRISVTKRNPAGEEHKLAVLEMGDYFGEIALLSNVPRTATLLALTPCVLLSLSRSQFLAFMAKAPEVAARIQEDMAERLSAQAQC
jgi:ATP-binding cassette, subfamily B, bacterial